MDQRSNKITNSGKFSQWESYIKFYVLNFSIKIKDINIYIYIIYYIERKKYICIHIFKLSRKIDRTKQTNEKNIYIIKYRIIFIDKIRTKHLEKIYISILVLFLIHSNVYIHISIHIYSFIFEYMNTYISSVKKRTK